MLKIFIASNFVQETQVKSYILGILRCSFFFTKKPLYVMLKHGGDFL